MKVQTEILAIKIQVECPHCYELQDGFVGDPRGEQCQCEFCAEEFVIDKDSDIEIR